MTLSSFHTHCNFCHGKNTAEEMVLEAINLGCKEIGFSCHSPLDFEKRWSMTDEKALKYREEIRRLKDKYAGEIKIYLGVEQDYFSNTDTDEYDYVIGSVHFVKKGDTFIPVDTSADFLKNAVKELYNGNTLALVEDYYKEVADVYNKTGCNIVGHFDLITKFEEKEKIFDTEGEEYKSVALGAVDALLKTPAVFEINTGAISRGYRTTPYPEGFIVDYIGERSGGFVISPDTHETATLLFGMNEVEKSINAKGYRIFKTMEEILKNK